MGNTNKILVIILSVVILITAALGGYYLYTQYGPVNYPAGSLSVFNVSIPAGKVGQQYGATVQAVIYNQNVQISGTLASTLPTGLQFAPCQTEYNSPIVASLGAKNSFSSCGIFGIPTQSGNFTVRIYFSIKGGPQNVYKDLPLVISP